jgi:hypothetical protein
MGSDLASVLSQQEHNFLTAFGQATQELERREVWIGGQFFANAGNALAWTDGISTVDFGFPWKADQPNHGGRASSCLFFNLFDSQGDVSGTWESRKCNVRRSFVSASVL